MPSFFFFICLSLSFLSAKDLGNSTKFHPIDLISSKRADLIAKYIYAKGREWETKNLFGLNIYYRHLQVWDDYEENSNNIVFNDFQFTFNEILDSIKYNENIFCPVSFENLGIICDGAHCLVACLLYDRPIHLENTPTEFDYGFDFFRSRGLESKYLDAMALQYCELKSDSYVLIVFPAAVGRDDTIEDIISAHATIVYKKEVEFTKKGGINFLLTAYENKAFIKNPRAIERRVNASFPERLLKISKARVYLLQCNNLTIIQQCKEKIRKLFRIAKKSVHCTDTHLEAIILARTLFNGNSIHCLNHRNIISSPTFDQCFESYRAWLFLNAKESAWFCIDDDAVLAAYGIKDCNDLSFLVYRNEIPGMDLPKIENHNDNQKYYQNSLDDILFDPVNHFFYKGVKFCSLSVLKKMKECRGEKEDISNIILIDELEAAHREPF